MLNTRVLVYIIISHTGYR